MKDHYQILHLPETATADQIEANYRRLSKAFHPEACPDDPVAHETYRALFEAYTVLSDPERRQEYDRMRLCVSDVRRSQRWRRRKRVIVPAFLMTCAVSLTAAAIYLLPRLLPSQPRSGEPVTRKAKSEAPRPSKQRVKQSRSVAEQAAKPPTDARRSSHFTLEPPKQQPRPDKDPPRRRPIDESSTKRAADQTDRDQEKKISAGKKEDRDASKPDDSALNQLAREFDTWRRVAAEHLRAGSFAEFDKHASSADTRFQRLDYAARLILDLKSERRRREALFSEVSIKFKHALDVRDNETEAKRLLEKLGSEFPQHPELRTLRQKLARYQKQRIAALEAEAQAEQKRERRAYLRKVEEKLRSLRMKDTGVRSNAARELYQMIGEPQWNRSYKRGTDEYEAVVCGFLSVMDKYAPRVWASKALRKLDCPESPSMMRALSRGDKESRARVAQIYYGYARQGSRFSQNVILALGRALNAGDPNLARYAALALLELAKNKVDLTRALPRMRDYYKAHTERRHRSTRSTIASALDKFRQYTTNQHTKRMIEAVLRNN